MDNHDHTNAPEETEAVVERRGAPVRRLDDKITLGLLTALVGVGIAWGTATAALSQKLNRNEFVEHVLSDSLRRTRQDATLFRIEEKLDRNAIQQDSTSLRLQRLVCDKKPAYCR